MGGTGLTPGIAAIATTWGCSNLLPTQLASVTSTQALTGASLLRSHL
jgi:hypothetical protein